MTISKQSLLIRADAGGELGTGHVMRMIALAQAYMRRGGQVVITSAHCPEPIINRVLELGIEHRMLNGCEPGDAQDLAATLQLCKEHQVQWLVLDGYHFDEEYQQRIAGHGIKVLCVDDYGHCKTWDCDAVLNQNLGAEKWAPRNSKRADTQWLLGSSFALIREEFLDSIKNAKEKKFPARRILVTMGGADPDNVSQRVLDALEQTKLKDLEIRVLVGGANPHQQSLSQFEETSRHQIEFLLNVRDMPAMYEWADAVVSAGGSTCWEWLAYGLPGVALVIAENQIPIVDELTKHKLAVDMRRQTELQFELSAHTLNEWLAGEIPLQDFECRRSMIDSRGADRVAALLDGALNITIATEGDGWLINDVHRLQKDLMSMGHHVTIVNGGEDIPTSDILFLLSFWSLISKEALEKSAHNIVIHASDLPKGRGWSPVSWQVIEGKDSIPFSLFEATDQADAGDIYMQTTMALEGSELLHEIQHKQASTQFDLCRKFVMRYPEVITQRQKQVGEATYYKRRGPKDSELDANQTIASQFDLLRTVDNANYPAFFKMRGRTYKLCIEVMESGEINE